MAAPTRDEAIVAEQIRYYRARAGEYDATSVAPDDQFGRAEERIRAELRELAPHGRILELAAGTGLWTGLLAEFASELTAVDASPEMLRLNAQKTRDPRVRFVVSDVFALRPEASWDVVFFGAWLSHVPPGRFEAFWELVTGLLAPGGRAVFVDEVAPGFGNEEWLDPSGGLIRRRLIDGSAYRAIKVLWRPAQLERRLRALGWEAEVHAVRPFYLGRATPAERVSGSPRGDSPRRGRE